MNPAKLQLGHLDGGMSAPLRQRSFVRLALVTTPLMQVSIAVVHCPVTTPSSAMQRMPSQLHGGFVGCSVGVVVGTAVVGAAVVGASVGTAVGAVVGATVVGASVGATVVGLSVGVTVVGTVTGSSVGTSIGSTRLSQTL